MNIYAINTLKEALDKASCGDVIYLEDRIYYEKIVIEVPNLTIIGKKNSKISYNVSHGTLIPGTNKKYGTTGSASVLVKDNATGFTAINVTFENNFDSVGQKNAQAVALKIECNNSKLDSCKILGKQDTLYIDYGKNNLVKNCYIEGDVDFIFGSADCTFENCIIKALKTEKNVAYFTAPSTYINNQEGFNFKNCTFICDKDLDCYLGRPWFPGGALMPVYPKVKFINCKLDENIKLYLKKMHENDSSSYIFGIENCEIGCIL